MGLDEGVNPVVRYLIDLRLGADVEFFSHLDLYLDLTQPGLCVVTDPGRPDLNIGNQGVELILQLKGEIWVIFQDGDDLICGGGNFVYVSANVQQQREGILRNLVIKSNIYINAFNSFAKCSLHQ